MIQGQESMLNKSRTKNSRKSEQGFSLIEAVIAIFLLTIGLVGAAGAITYALEFSAISKNVTKAKLVIVASIEEIETLRNSKRLGYPQIANVGNVNNTDAENPFGGFSTGFRDVSIQPGPDGVSGTDDDFTARGADGIYGTADDFNDPTLTRQGFWRKITVSELSSTLKKIEVRVRYVGRDGKKGEIVGVSYLNDDARVTRN